MVFISPLGPESGSMNSADFDVAIIGAGPAGLTAARILETQDISYVLMSRESSPGETKACGGFIPARAFREFGLRPFPGCHEVRSVRMKFPGLAMKRIDFERAAGYNVSRGDLGTYLRGLLSKDAPVWMNRLVTRLDVDRDGCTVVFWGEDGRESLRASLVIDCSGVSPVSVKCGLVRDRLPPDSIGYAVQYHLTLPHASSPEYETNDFYYGSEFSPHGYAWVFPRGPLVVVGTGGLVSEVRASGRRLQEYLDHLVQETEPARSELSGAETVRTEAALMPLAGVVRPSSAERVMLAGDAAGHCSPITGEGIYYSMVGGECAARAAVHAVSRGDFSAKTLRGYERAWTRRIGSDLKWGLWLQRRLIRSGSRSLGPALLSSEKNIRAIGEMLLGERTVLRAILSVAPSYARLKIGERFSR